MASAGSRKTPTGRYKVWWRLDDASQGSQSFDTRDQARDFKHDLLTRLARGSWVDPRLGKQAFETWAREWWEVWSTDPDRSPATLQATEGRLRRHLLPIFGQHQPVRSRSHGPPLAERAARTVGHDTVMACDRCSTASSSAEDDRRIDANPVRRSSPEAPSTRRRCASKRRTYSPEEFGRSRRTRPFYRDHCLPGRDGLRAGSCSAARRPGRPCRPAPGGPRGPL